MTRRRAIRIVVAALAVLALAAGALYTPEMPPEELLTRHSGPDSQFIAVDGSNVHLRDQGPRDRPALLLLHGSNASLHVWEKWVASLAGSFRVVTLDLPGHGLTGPWARGDYSVAAYADLVLRLADHLDLGRFAIGGHSMGGAVAWTLAARHPQRVQALVLVAPAAYPRQGAAPLALQLARAPVVGELMAIFKPRWMVTRTLRQTYANPARLEVAQVERHHDLMRRAGNREATLRRLRQAVPLDPAPLRTLEVPTLILWGAADRWTPEEDVRRLNAEIQGSVLRVYADAGHALMEEAAGQSAEDVRNFLLK